MQYRMLSLAFIIYKKIAPNELTLGAITLLYLISYLLRAIFFYVFRDDERR